MKNENNSRLGANGVQDDTLIADLLAIFLRHKWSFVLSVFVCLGLGVLYVKFAPKVYHRKAMVLIKDDNSTGTMGEGMAFQNLFSTGANSVHNELGLLKSNYLMGEVVGRLSLEKSYRLDEPFHNRELYTSSPIKVDLLNINPSQSLEFSVTLGRDMLLIEDLASGGIELRDSFELAWGDTLATSLGSIVVEPTLFMGDEFVGRKILVERKDPRMVTSSYNNRLEVTLLDNLSTLITIALEDENSARAEDVIDTLIEVYMDDAVDDKNLVLDNTAEFIVERLAIIEAELYDIDAQIETYKKTNKLTDLASESSMYLASFSNLDSQGLNLENQLKMAEFIRVYLDDSTKIAELIPANIGLDNPALQAQIAEYNTLMSRRNKLLEGSSSSNPLVVELQNMLTPLRASIVISLDNMVSMLELQIRNFEAKEAENNSRIADVPSQQKYIVSVQRQQKIKEELYLYLLNKKEESELQSSINTSNCRIVDKAQGPVLAVAPRPLVILLFCFILGLAFPAALLYIASLFDTAVTTRKQVKEALTIPFLGDIPFERNVAEGNIVVREGSRDATSEAFKIVRDNIDFLGERKASRGSVVQITSFSASSGKTFVITNLAATIALSKARVVIVDLDIRKGSLSKQSGIGVSQPGVSQYLSGKIADPASIIRSYRDQGFDLVSSGALPPNPSELLKSDRLALLIDFLSARYDYVFVDNPPHAVVVDAAICARVCDQTIYIIRSGYFDKRLLPDLQELYDSGKMRNMGLLLNGVDSKNLGYGYGYGNEQESKSKFWWSKK